MGAGAAVDVVLDFVVVVVVFDVEVDVCIIVVVELDDGRAAPPQALTKISRMGMLAAWTKR